MNTHPRSNLHLALPFLGGGAGWAFRSACEKPGPVALEVGVGFFFLVALIVAGIIKVDADADDKK